MNAALGLFAGVVAFGAGMVSPALADTGAMLEQISPQDVVSSLDELGIGYSIEIDPRGYPMVQVDPGIFPSEQFSVLFFACDDVAMACEDISLWAWFDSPDGSAHGAINAWNDPFQKSRRWATGYLDDENDPALVLHVNATGGIGEEALQIMIHTYMEDLIAFAELLASDEVAALDADQAETVSATLTTAYMDPEMVRLTRLVKEYGGAGFSHTKQYEKK